MPDLTIITPSNWLARHVKKSFLNEYPVRVINNGIDLNVFKPLEGKGLNTTQNHLSCYILGVASTWDKRKGLSDFIELRKISIVKTYFIHKA